MYIIYYYLKGQCDISKRKRAIVSAGSIEDANNLLTMDYFVGAIEIITTEWLHCGTVLLLEGRN